MAVTLTLACAGPTAAPQGSATQPRPAPALDDEPDQAPRLAPAAREYTTAPRPGGVVGGRPAQALSEAIVEALGRRGDRAEPDGALAATAHWFLKEAAEGRKPDAADGETVARWYGFAGTVLTSVAFTARAGDADLWRRALDQVPRNLPITRYGVRTGAGGDVAAVVFGSLEVALAPFPKSLPPGRVLRLDGEVAARFAHAIVYVTGVDGKVQQTRLPGRRVEASVPLPVAGVYKVEVMGDGASGPVVLANVPVYVGVPERELAARRPGGAAPVTADVEGRMLALLNAARREAGVPPLAPDGELRAVALAHSEDMAAGRFFGHVSPTTGGPVDRVRRSGVVVSQAGENVAKADSAQAAHDVLMSSPGHRANMVAPEYTHVGIGVAPAQDAPGQILATLVFGRRPRPGATPPTAAEVREAIAALRSSKGLAAITADPLLQAAAQAGADALARGSSPDGALTAAGAALQRELRRRRVSRRAGCARLLDLVDLEQLADQPVFVRPDLRRAGVALTVRQDGRLTLVVLTEGRGSDGACGG